MPATIPILPMGGDHLYCAYHNGSKWNYQTVDSSPGVGYYTSIALDAAGKVYISYYDRTNYDLKYATNASGSWVTTTVDSSGDVGKYTSIALDKSGNVHISYAAAGASNYDVVLKYATNVSGSWVTTTVDSRKHTDEYISIIGEYTSIAVDTSGKVHISYFDEYLQALKYATNASGSWVTKTVDSSGDVGEYTSIAVDTSGKAHISYFGSGLLKYATNASGSWVTTTVDIYGGWENSTAVDTSGKVHISYLDNYP